MKITIFTLFSIGLLLSSSCYFSNNAVSKNSVMESNLKTVPISENVSTEVNSVINQNINKVHIQSANTKVWVGFISFETETVVPDGVWSGGDSTPSDISEADGGLKIGTSYDVDIMNCGGYLGSGEVSFIKEGNFQADWRVKIIQETVASDAKEKIDRCKGNSETLSGSAFAITPPNKKRRNIKISNTNTKELFASLTKDTQKWLKNKYASDIHKSGNLSLEEDNWTDIDGDGKIDLVYAFTNYDEEHSSGVIMLLVNGKWKDIGDVRD